MSKSSDKLKTGSGAPDARRKLSVSARAAGRSFTLPGAVPDDEISSQAVRQNTILSTSARGLVTGSGVGDDQRRLNVSTPAAGHMMFALPGAVEEEEERSLEVVRQNTILSTSAHGLRTGSGVCDAQRKLNVSTPAAGQESIAPPGAAENEKRRGAEKQTNQQKNKLQALMRICCVCQNEDDMEPSDPVNPQPGPSDLQSRAREDKRQNSPSGLEPAGCEKPVYCQSGSSTLEITGLQEEADPKNGPFDQEPSAQNDQTDSQPGPSVLQSRAREDNRQYSPLGLEPAGLEEPVYCQSGSSTLEITGLQEEADPEYGPFDQEPSAQNDQTNSQPGPSVLQSRAREDNRQYSPLGLEPAGLEEPVYCQSGSSTLEITGLQEEADPKHGPSDQEPSAQSDPANPQPGPSSAKRLYYLARVFKSLYIVKKQIGKGGFGRVYEGTRTSDGRKVAIKFIKKLWLRDHLIKMRGHADPLYSEVAFNLMLLKHEKSPYIVEMLDWFEEEDRYIIVLEYPQPCMDLLDFVKSKGGRLSEIQARHLMRQAVLASMHCIDCGVYHKDFNPQNVLVKTDTMDLKVIDFGLCRLVESLGTRFCSGRRFVVSETVRDLGILLYKMLHGPHPSTSNNTVSTAVISKECDDLIDRCLDSRARRPTLEELLQHEWFNEE